MSFENPEAKNYEVLPKSQFEIESVLESGEILSVSELKGSWGIYEVEMKDGTLALFRQDDAQDFLFEAKNLEASISGLERLVFNIDKVLEFGLIPPVVARKVNLRSGSLQYRIEDSLIAKSSEVHWTEIANGDDINHAAILDHLLDVKDRGTHNFLVKPQTGKIWLVDHDFFMFWKKDLSESVITDHVLNTGGLRIGGFEIRALEKFLAHSDQLTIGIKTAEAEVLKRAVERAKILLETV